MIIKCALRQLKMHFHCLHHMGPWAWTMSIFRLLDVYHNMDIQQQQQLLPLQEAKGMPLAWGHRYFAHVCPSRTTPTEAQLQQVAACTWIIYWLLQASIGHNSGWGGVSRANGCGPQYQSS
ncbi:UNVERIFIED_CONTAM: hypothetical protein K2H54_034775 [Gekko kuhli]